MILFIIIIKKLLLITKYTILSILITPPILPLSGPHL